MTMAEHNPARSVEEEEAWLRKVDEIDEATKPTVSNSVEEDALFTASSTGNLAHLKHLLSDPSMVETALAFRKRPHHLVLSSIQNVCFMVVIAAGAGQPSVTAFLLLFAHEHGISDDSLVTIDSVAAAIESRNVDVLRTLFEAKPSLIEYRHGLGTSLLAATLAKGIHLGLSKNSDVPMYNNLYTPVIAFLLENGADPNDVDGEPMNGVANLLNSAAMRASLDIVDLLLQHGARIQGSRAVHFASWQGRIDVLEALLNAGADLNELCEPSVSGYQRVQESPLHKAVRYKQVKAVQWLLDHGANDTVRDGEDHTALEIASSSGDVMMVDVLRRRGNEN